MADMAAIRALAERLEQATGADRRIDNELSLVFWEPMPDSPEAWPQRYTWSLDAAVALVERVRPGWGWSIHGGGPDATAALIKPFMSCHEEWHRAPTSALALLRALVASLIEEAKEGA